MENSDNEYKEPLKKRQENYEIDLIFFLNTDNSVDLCNAVYTVHPPCPKCFLFKTKQHESREGENSVNFNSMFPKSMKVDIQVVKCALRTEA